MGSSVKRMRVKNGDVPVDFPSSQQIAVTVGGSGGASVGLNLAKLIEARSLFW